MARRAPLRLRRRAGGDFNSRSVHAPSYVFTYPPCEDGHVRPCAPRRPDVEPLETQLLSVRQDHFHPPGAAPPGYRRLRTAFRTQARLLLARTPPTPYRDRNRVADQRYDTFNHRRPTATLLSSRSPTAPIPQLVAVDPSVRTTVVYNFTLEGTSSSSARRRPHALGSPRPFLVRRPLTLTNARSVDHRALY